MTFTATKTLSDALALTADDVEHLLEHRIDEFSFYMGSWLRTGTTVDGARKLCETCLAGAVMVRRFDGVKTLTERLGRVAAGRRYPVVVNVMPHDLEARKTDPITPETTRKLLALESARLGLYVHAVKSGWPGHPLTDEAISKLGRIPRALFGEKNHFSPSEAAEALQDLRTRIIPAVQDADC
ncbi:MAG: hypothetical protein OXG35_13045 [Acidobacteria bacterium]|nr:hypothetical protein [Acidobacteriota bacterium]